MPRDSHSSSRRRGGSPRSFEGADQSPRRVIRSDVVRYPGMPEGGLEQEGLEEQGTRKRLRPARDAGISIERRAARERRRAHRAQRNLAITAGLAIVGLLIGGFTWRWVSDSLAAAEPMTTRSAPSTVVVKAAEPVAAPTPIFATLGSLKLRSPVAVADLTEVGFHQASYSYAMSMRSPLPDANMTEAKRLQGTQRERSAQPVSSDAALPGQVLRMWRNRPGQPDTAADIGALAGSSVVAPVTGTVVLVKRYDLYGKYPDVQVHIRPDGYGHIDCVLIHIDAPTVKAGNRVTAGITPLGKVRKLSDRIHHQLADYTKDPGDHVHLQLNDSRDPSYEGLKGAITVSGS